MLMHHLLGDALRVAILFSLTLLSMPLLRGTSSATRRLILALSLGGALVVPLVSMTAPSWYVRAPEAVLSLRTTMTVDPIVPPIPSLSATLPTEPALASPPRAEARERVGLRVMIGCAWCLGATAVLARLIVGFVRTRRIVRRATVTSSWSRAVARALVATGQRADVRMTGDLDAPAVAGVLRPVILVPNDSTSWTDERRYGVLLHELAHVRQRDCLAQWVAQVACAAHWFNPLAWMVAARLRAERELAADDAVVAAGARASGYAEDLLAIASAVGASRQVPQGALGMAERSILGVRVRAIVSTRRLRRPPSAASTALVGSSVGLGVLALACATPGAVTAAKITPTTSGASVALETTGSSLDPRIQGIAEEELTRAMEQWKAASGTVLVLSPATGEVLANAGRANGVVTDVAVRNVYVPGSTLKPFTLAAALEERVVSPTERIDCEGGTWTRYGQTIHDSHTNGVLTVPEMLELSSNVGFGKIQERLGGERLGRWLRTFHFGTAPSIEGAAGGTMPAAIDDRSAVGFMVATGEGMTASPLQVASAYGALANGGFYVPPTFTHRAGDAPREQVVQPQTAQTVVTMLEGVVSHPEATGTRAHVEGERVAGKTGTASWTAPDGSEHVYASFVGLVPAASPRFVILAGLEDPKGEAGGGMVAAPVFSRVATRALAH